jgi:23S rRNA pseudouridine1911/1915/1917 synthase
VRQSFGHIGEVSQDTFESYVPQNLEGLRLDQYLGLRFKYFSREQWKESVREGDVRVDGAVSKPTYRLKAGEHVTFAGKGVEEPPVPLHAEILYEDDWLVAFAKPAHIPMHHGGKYLKNSFLQLVRQLQKGWGIEGTIRFLHRLDMETSGVVLATKSEDVHKFLYDQFENDHIRKTYLAVAFGAPDRERWTADAPIGARSDSRIRIKLWDSPGGLPSETEFMRREVSADRRFSLLEARPRTGRTNQIRVHAAVSGHHLVGDKTYYPDEEVFLRHQDAGYDEWVHGRVLFHRCLLHAWKLRFLHPVSKQDVEVVCRPPEDFVLGVRSFVGNDCYV